MINLPAIRNWSTQELRALIYVLLALAVVYFPFVDKAFTIDDTLFLKAAEQILETPFDFYRGEVNWYGIPDAQYVVNKNPPLVAYLIVSVASIFGFSEIALHSFFFLPLLLTATGIYVLGRQFQANPVYTAIFAVFTPVFLVHGTNVMTDSTMLMFWTWGVVFWRLGVESTAWKWFLLTGLTVSLGILTKYTCVFLLPLLIFSGVWKYRKVGRWLLAVIIPLIVIASFEYYTQAMYGKGLFLDAFVYAQERNPKQLVDYLDNSLIGLAFLGGCFPVALILAPLTGGRLLRSALVIFTIAILVLTFSRGTLGGQPFSNDGVASTALIVQFCIFALAGFCLVLACLKEGSRGLDHDSVFLLLWFFGVFVFVCYLNWTVNARSFLLLVPVMGLLLSRRLGEWNLSHGKLKNTPVYVSVAVAGLMSLATVYADYTWANTARTAAREITSKYSPHARVFFQGHWGFQYYMEKSGSRPLDFITPGVRSGDLVVIPVNNTNLVQLDARFVLVEVMRFSPSSFIAMMSPRKSSGFYASAWGPVPYSFERPRKELYYIYRTK